PNEGRETEFIIKPLRCGGSCLVFATKLSGTGGFLPIAVTGQTYRPPLQTGGRIVGTCVEEIALEKERSVIDTWSRLYGFQEEDIRKAMKKTRTPVLWINGLDCTGCMESFLRGISSTTELLLDWISLEYSELLSSASGHQAESHKGRISEEYDGKFVLVIEGAIPLKDAYLTVAGKSVREEIIATAQKGESGVGLRKLFGMGRASRGKTESDRIGFHPGTGAERARRPGPGMPTDRRCDDRDAPAPGDLRRNPRTGQQRTAKAVLPSNRPPGLPSETLFRQGLVCGVLRRRKVPERILPVQTGMQGALHLQRLRNIGLERHAHLPHRSRIRLHRVFGKKFLGQGAPVPSQ